MKIVMLTDLYVENSQYQENLLAKYYIKHGHEVTIIAGPFNDAASFYAMQYDKTVPAREYLDGRVKIIKLPYSLNLLNRIRRFAGVTGILERERPALIFIHDIHFNLAEAAAYKRSHPSCRIVLDYHADYTNSGKNWLSLKILHGVIRKRFLLRYRSAIDKIYPVVPVSMVFLHEVYGIPLDEQELLPLGADTDLSEEIRKQGAGADIRRQLGIQQDAKVIFTGGKFHPLKRTELLLEAFNMLADPGLHLIVVGESSIGEESTKAKLLELAANSPRIHFVGWLPGTDVYRYMDACDMAVFPASQSVLWQQAMSMGLPLIVGEGTVLGSQDPSYMNRHGNVIILAGDRISAKGIAQEISLLTGNEARLASLRAGALRTTAELLNYDRIVATTLA